MFRKKIKLKFFISLLVIFLISVIFLYRFFMVANEITRAEASRITTDTVNEIANRYLSENGDLYSNILVKDISSTGSISSINTDIEKINKLQTEMSGAILKGLSESDDIKVKIPFGNILGLPILLNIGPKIEYNLAPVSNVHVRFEDSFKSAGINQTQFSVNLIVDTEILYAISAYQSTISTTSTIPVVQLVLVGEIPDNYANIQR